MLIIAKKIDNILQTKNLSRQNLSDILKKDKRYVSRMFSGDRPFPKKIINKLVRVLEISREEFEGWVLADKYSKEVLKLAIENKNSFPFKRKSILTVKIDEILQQKNMSRTALAKEINYSQSGLNRMITGKINMSVPVVAKVSDVLGVSQNDIFSWILADRYSLQILEMACSCSNS